MRSFDETNCTYEQIITEIETGDIISFNIRNSGLMKISGEVRNFYFDNSRFVITVYDFFRREEKSFILDKNLKLVDPAKIKKIKRKNTRHSVHIPYNVEADSKKEGQKKTFVKIFSALVIIVFLFTSVPGLRISFIPTSYNYREFLSKKFSIYQLYNVVTSRLNYKPDVYDEWMTPDYAWTFKTGDCEEYANIISDYLNHHGVKNYVVGLNLRHQAVGHAVVFAKIGGFFYMIDPTRAVETAGIKKLANVNSLRDAVKIYSTLPVDIFKIPSVNYEKVVVDTIY